MQRSKQARLYYTQLGVLIQIKDGTRPGSYRGAMPNDAQRLRERALTCRNLAKSARSEVDASILEDMAAELEDEARLIDLEHRVGEATNVI